MMQRCRLIVSYEEVFILNVFLFSWSSYLVYRYALGSG